MSNSPFVHFAQGLLSDGDAAVGPLPEILQVTAADRRQVSELLIEAERMLRFAAPGNPPALDVDAAFWALQVFGWAGCTILDRQLERTQLPPSLSQESPSNRRLENHWSVDVVFRYFAQLCQRARRIALTDELHASLEAIAAQWPLAAVGMPIESSPEALSLILRDPSLGRMLVDRVTACQDRRLAAEPAILAVLRDDAGAYAEVLGIEELTGDSHSKEIDA